MARSFANVDSGRLGVSANIASTTASATSAIFGAQTYMIRVATSAAVNIRIGAPAQGPYTINAAVWSASLGGTATFTTTAPHALGVGATVTIAAVNPGGFNGTYTTMAGTTGSTIVVPLAADPTAYVSGGTATGSAVLTAIATDTLIPTGLPGEYFQVNPGQQLATIGTATVNVTEITQ